jgi:hypothetical protein
MDKSYARNPLLNNAMLPVDIVLAPEWWHRHAGICFDRDFFFHPARRVEDEQKMEEVLYEKWGQFGLGTDREPARPEVGAVHLAAGYLISQMLGCQVRYSENHPPQVVPQGIDKLTIEPDRAFESPAFRDFQKLTEALKSRYGRVCGDVNWSGILNVALDIRGQDVFMDMHTSPDDIKQSFSQIASVIERFVGIVESRTGTSSISVNRNVKHFEKPVFLHSECSHTMISEEFYEKFLMPCDITWSRHHRPFGIHYCGPDPHRYAQTFTKLPHLDFLDVGWGGDVVELRKFLPNTFLNIRLSPVEIIEQSPDEIHSTITRLVSESANPYLTGICCINMDDKVSDSKVNAIFETVDILRRKYKNLEQ